MKITTRLEISKSDDDKFKEMVDAYNAASIPGTKGCPVATLEDLVKYHRLQLNAAFRLGLDERNRKTKKD